MRSSQEVHGNRAETGRGFQGAGEKEAGGVGDATDAAVAVNEEPEGK